MTELNGYVPAAAVTVLTGKAASARRAHCIVTDSLQDTERLFFRVGAALVVIHDHALYQELGAETWGAYLGMPEVRLSRSHAHRLMDIARAFRPIDGKPVAALTDDELVQIGVARASAILPMLKQKPERRAQLLEQAAVLPLSDLTKEVRSVRADRALDQIEEAQVEYGRKIIALGYKLRDGEEPRNTLEEIMSVAFQCTTWLDQLTPNGGHVTNT